MIRRVAVSFPGLHRWESVPVRRRFRHARLSEPGVSVMVSDEVKG